MALFIAPQIKSKGKENFTETGRPFKKGIISDFLKNKPMMAIKKPKYRGIGPRAPNSKANKKPASTTLSGNKNLIGFKDEVMVFPVIL